MENGEGRREKGEGQSRREKGKGPGYKGNGRREKGEGRWMGGGGEERRLLPGEHSSTWRLVIALKLRAGKLESRSVALLHCFQHELAVASQLLAGKLESIASIIALPPECSGQSKVLVSFLGGNFSPAVHN